jgi:hypothetical protein
MERGLVSIVHSLVKYIPSKIYVKTNSSMSNGEESSEGGQSLGMYQGGKGKSEEKRWIQKYISL